MGDTGLFLDSVCRIDTDSDGSLPCIAIAIGIYLVIRARHEGYWHKEKVFFLVPCKEPRIAEYIRAGSGISECEGRELFRIRDISDIVEIYFDSGILGSSPLICLGVVSDTDEMGRVIRVEIGRISWNLQLSENLRSGRITEIYGEERINLFESHEIESVSDESGALEILVFSDILEFSENLEFLVEDEQFG